MYAGTMSHVIQQAPAASSVSSVLYMHVPSVESEDSVDGEDSTTRIPISMQLMGLSVAREASIKAAGSLRRYILAETGA